MNHSNCLFAVRCTRQQFIEKTINEDTALVLCEAAILFSPACVRANTLSAAQPIGGTGQYSSVRDVPMVGRACDPACKKDDVVPDCFSEDS